VRGPLSYSLVVVAPVVSLDSVSWFVSLETFFPGYLYLTLSCWYIRFTRIFMCRYFIYGFLYPPLRYFAQIVTVSQIGVAKNIRLEKKVSAQMFCFSPKWKESGGDSPPKVDPFVTAFL